jgi:hypothetical protein
MAGGGRGGGLASREKKKPTSYEKFPFRHPLDTKFLTKFVGSCNLKLEKMSAHEPSLDDASLEDVLEDREDGAQ